MENSLVNVSNDLARIVESLGPSVVSVKGRRRYPSSGLAWSPEVVVTADHAIEEEEEISVQMAGGKTVAATLAGRDPGSDLAVLKLASPLSAHSGLPQAQNVKPGEFALVLGRSPDSGVNASLGIVSAVSGPWRTWRGGQLDAYLRLDAKFFPNSSGGIVVNSRAEFIGIATNALSRIAGLAIPASTVKRVTERLLEKGFLPRGYLGIGVHPVALPAPLREKISGVPKSGLIVLTVEPAGPADKAGVLIGDILLSVGDTAVEQTSDLQTYSDSAAIGSSIKLKLLRGGALKEASLTVGERPRRQS